jgi:hypothetical protein
MVGHAKRAHSPPRGRGGAVSRRLRAAHYANLAVMLSFGSGLAQNGPPPGYYDEQNQSFPKGLFDSPVVDHEVAAKAKPPVGEKVNGRKREGGACHHYRDWFYDYPQPC